MKKKKSRRKPSLSKMYHLLQDLLIQKENPKLEHLLVNLQVSHDSPMAR